MRRLLLAVTILCSVSALAQVMGFNVGGRVIASQYGLWQAQTTNGVNAGLATLFLDRCYVNAGLIAGKQFIPWATNAPITISDSNTETVTPVFVQTPMTGQQTCSVTANFSNPHPQGATVYSATHGLAEALNDTATGGNPNGGVVVIDPSWLGTNSMITAYTGGNTAVFIEDLRNGAVTYWKWNGSSYAVFVLNINVFGTGAKVASTDLVGFPATNDCVIWLANGRLGDAGSGCGIGSVSGTQNRLAKIGAGGASAGDSDIQDASSVITILNSAGLDFSGAGYLKLPSALNGASTLAIVSNLLHVNLNGTDKTVATIDGVISGVSSLPWLTTTGTGPLSLSPASGQAANLLLATPDNATGTVGLRALVGRDLPSSAVQNNQSNSFSSGTQTFGAGSTLVAVAADHTSPIKSGTTAAKPATCTFTAGAAMEVYLATDATAGQNLYFCTATNTWTQVSGGGNPVWSALQNAGGNLGITLGNFTSTFTAGTATTTPWIVQDTTGNTASGTGAPLFWARSQGTSTAVPFEVTAQGTSNGIYVTSAGLLSALGTGGLDATKLLGNLSLSNFNNGSQASGFTAWMGDLTWQIVPLQTGSTAASYLAVWADGHHIGGYSGATEDSSGNITAHSLTSNTTVSTTLVGGGEIYGTAGSLPAANSISASQIGLFLGSNGVSGTALYGNYGGDGWGPFVRGDLSTGLVDVGQVDQTTGANGFGTIFQRLSDYLACTGGFFNYDSTQAIGSRWTCNGYQSNVFTSPYTVLASDKFDVLVDTVAGVATINIPGPTGSFVPVFGFYVDATKAGDTLTLAANGAGCSSCLINGAATLAIPPGATALVYAADNTQNWKAMISYPPGGVTTVN